MVHPLQCDIDMVIMEENIIFGDVEVFGSEKVFEIVSNGSV